MKEEALKSTICRTNPFSGEAVALCQEAAEKYDRIIELTWQFEIDPPFVTEPRMQEWSSLRQEFGERWPREYMLLVD